MSRRKSSILKRVVRPLVNVGNRIASLVPNALSPFTARDLDAMRMKILYNIAQTGFHRYSQILNDVDRRIGRVIVDDKLILKDDIWGNKRYWGPKFNNKPLPWVKNEQSMFWSEDMPDIRRQFYDDRGRFSNWTLASSNQDKKLGVKAVLGNILNDKYVDTLVGNVSWMSYSQKVLFYVVLSSYFHNNRMMFPVACNMDYAYRQLVRNVLGNDNFKRTLLAAGLGGGGPFVLKILQQLESNAETKKTMGRNSAHAVGDSDLEFAAKQVLNQVPALNNAELRLVLDKLRQDTNVGPYAERVFTEAGPLGSASLAVAYPVKNGKPGTVPTRQDKTVAVLKFIKPMYVYYYLCEVDFFLRRAWCKLRKRVYSKKANIPTHIREIVLIKARKLLLFFVRAFAQEFNYQQEAEYTRMGYKYYNNPRARVRTVQLKAYSNSVLPCLVTELALGKSLTDWIGIVKTEKDPNKQLTRMAVLYQTVSNVYKMWLREVLMKSGFFHADMHAGNMLIDESGTVWIIDFGSAGRLTRTQQKGLLSAIVKTAYFQQPLYSDIIFMNKYAADRKDKIPRTAADENKFNLLLSQIQSYHNANIRIGVQFITSISKLCQVKLDRTEKLDISNSILRYSKGLYFASLFLDFAEVAQDVGSCIAGDVLLFGRGTAYLNTAITQITTLCGDSKICPEFLMTDALPNALHKLPLRLIGIGITSGLPAWWVKRGSQKLGPATLTQRQILHGRKRRSLVLQATTGHTKISSKFANGVPKTRLGTKPMTQAENEETARLWNVNS